MSKYEKILISLRYFLLGKGYYGSLDALEFGASYHTGTRKDGVTPEFQHQVEIAHYIRTLPNLMYPQETITAVLIHDVPEDYNVSHEEIRLRFGPLVARAVWLMDKHKNSCFDDIGGDAIASIAKGGDRVHNLQTMTGVFTREKQRSYIQQAEAEFLPMLKQARRAFPQQEAAYENIKHMMTSQIQLLSLLNT